MHIEKVLFPTDFSEVTNQALAHALRVTREYNAHLTLLHVRTLYSDDPNRPAYQLLDEGQYEEYVIKSIGELSKRSEPLDKVTTEVIRSFTPETAILDYIHKNSIDLTVMGTHGRSSLATFFLGSVAEQVVRHARCPVLTVAEGRQSYLNNPDYKNILIAYDFSKNSKLAARRGKELARRFGAHLQALYIIQQEVPPNYYGIWKNSIVRDLPQLREEVKESLLETIGNEESTDLEVTVGIGEAKAHTEISEFARTHQVDLIVMGTHGRSGVDRILLGSTAERVVRIAPCPVLTFKLASNDSGAMED